MRERPDSQRCLGRALRHHDFYDVTAKPQIVTAQCATEIGLAIRQKGQLLQTSKPRCTPCRGLFSCGRIPTPNLPAAIRDQPFPLPQGDDPSGPRRLAASSKVARATR